MVYTDFWVTQTKILTIGLFWLLGYSNQNLDCWSILSKAWVLVYSVKILTLRHSAKFCMLIYLCQIFTFRSFWLKTAGLFCQYTHSGGILPNVGVLVDSVKSLPFAQNRNCLFCPDVDLLAHPAHPAQTRYFRHIPPKSRLLAHPGEI